MEREDRSGLACSLGREARKDRLEFARAWIDQTARGSGQAVLKKVQNEANGNRPQIACHQIVNVGRIRSNLCKTNPIPEEARRTSRVSRVRKRAWPLGKVVSSQ